MNINAEELHGLAVTMTAIEGKGSLLADLIVEASKKVNQMKGCKLYLVQQSLEDPDTIFVNEVWTSRDQHQASLNDDGVGEIISKARPLIANMEFTPTDPISER